ncbi:unnamed protein product [Cylindrotheca closterium]|uniref:Uncharacterized protein n=1 Tax=Cylindrotheca closterium TaxID=2856 RepID=A0AAD2JLV2_9STRA|nr:unnamed protein product [Cylindrotheca closterium]
MSVPSRRWGNSKSRPAGETSDYNASLQPRQNALNVKNYLGLQQAMSCSLDTCPEGETMPFSTSPMDMHMHMRMRMRMSRPSSTNCTGTPDVKSNASGSGGNRTNRNDSGNGICIIKKTTARNRQQSYTNQRSDNIVNPGITVDLTRKSSHTGEVFKPTILLEDMPHHGVPQTQTQTQTMQHQQPRQPALRKPSSRSTVPVPVPVPVASRENHRAISSAARFRQQAFSQDFSNEVTIDADLDDIDSSYMMSIYMNEESSIYTKGTASTASTSSSSLASKRSRHPGASHKRREDVKQAEEEQPQKESGFLRSMKQSSSSFFVEGNWSQKYGWYLSKTWDATPGEGWDKPDPIFDKKEERLVDI